MPLIGKQEVFAIIMGLVVALAGFVLLLRAAVVRKGDNSVPHWGDWWGRAVHMVGVRSNTIGRCVKVVTVGEN
jgi:hypothetical protein